MINQQQERVAFEKWAAENLLTILREDGQYIIYTTQIAWESWLFRASSNGKPN